MLSSKLKQFVRPANEREGHTLGAMPVLTASQRTCHEPQMPLIICGFLRSGPGLSGSMRIRGATADEDG